MDFLFFGLTATTIFAFRQREIPTFRKTKDVGYPGEKIMYRVPGHPVTTVLFVAICWWVVANTIYRYPQNSLIGFAILLAGMPVYWMWSRKAVSPQRRVDTEQGEGQKAN